MPVIANKYDQTTTNNHYEMINWWLHIMQIIIKWVHCRSNNETIKSVQTSNNRQIIQNNWKLIVK